MNTARKIFEVFLRILKHPQGVARRAISRNETGRCIVLILHDQDDLPRAIVVRIEIIFTLENRGLKRKFVLRCGFIFELNPVIDALLARRSTGSTIPQMK